MLTENAYHFLEINEPREISFVSFMRKRQIFKEKRDEWYCWRAHICCKHTISTMITGWIQKCFKFGILLLHLGWQLLKMFFYFFKNFCSSKFHCLTNSNQVKEPSDLYAASIFITGKTNHSTMSRSESFGTGSHFDSWYWHAQHFSNSNSLTAMLTDWLVWQKCNHLSYWAKNKLPSFRKVKYGGGFKFRIYQKLFKKFFRNEKV